MKLTYKPTNKRVVKLEEYDPRHPSMDYRTHKKIIVQSEKKPTKSLTDARKRIKECVRMKNIPGTMHDFSDELQFLRKEEKKWLKLKIKSKSEGTKKQKIEIKDKGTAESNNKYKI